MGEEFGSISGSHGRLLGPSLSALDAPTDRPSNSPSPPEITAYLFIPSFVELPKPQTSLRPRSRFNNTAQTPARPRNSRAAIKPHFLVQLPRPVRMIDDQGEPWMLRCVCEDKTSLGILVQCEKCASWQHAICVGLNDRTIPDKYVCEHCGVRPIRCKCNNNLNYRFGLIRCSHCGYSVHRRCAGLLYGPLPRGDFICSYCGKWKSKYSKVELPSAFCFHNDEQISFSQDVIDSLHSQMLNGPFGDFLTSEIVDQSKSATDFCETLYDRFRSFFFVCHPLNPNSISRKKRHTLFMSFITGAELLCHIFFRMDHQTFISIFNALLVADLYKPLEVIEPRDRPPGELSLSENTRVELETLQNIPTLPEIPPPMALERTEAGWIAQTDLHQDTFIGFAEGFLADLEEFIYDDGVDSGLFQIADTRFVLDVRDVQNPFLSQIGRSMFGNVMIRLVRIGQDVKAAIFVGRALLTCYRSGDEFVLPAGEPLRFGIDFLPALVDDLGRWIGWNCADADQNQGSGGIRPSRDDRELQAAMRQIEGKRPKGSKTKRKELSQKKSKPSRKSGKRRGDMANEDMTLFDLFEADGPLDYHFLIGDETQTGESVRRPVRLFATQSSPTILRRPSSRSANLQDDTIEFEKSFEEILAADVKPIKFEPRPIPNTVGAMLKILDISDSG